LDKLVNQEPPNKCPGKPIIYSLPAKSVLVRFHSSAYSPVQFNPNPSINPYKGGRFDSIEPGDPYLYAGEDENVAISEILLRSIEPALTGRLVLMNFIKGKMISRIKTKKSLKLVKLHGTGLSQVGQDTWLTKSKSIDYPFTREWARSIKLWVKDCQGFRWRSNRYEDSFAYIFFEKFIFSDTFELKNSIPADSGPGLIIVRKVLRDNNVVIKR
jgi:hypothetical protein